MPPFRTSTLQGGCSPRPARTPWLQPELCQSPCRRVHAERSTHLRWNRTASRLVFQGPPLANSAGVSQPRAERRPVGVLLLSPRLSQPCLRSGYRTAHTRSRWVADSPFADIRSDSAVLAAGLRTAESRLPRDP